VTVYASSSYSNDVILREGFSVRRPRLSAFCLKRAVDPSPPNDEKGSDVRMCEREGERAREREKEGERGREREREGESGRKMMRIRI
jgi:hypothetical protein